MAKDEVALIKTPHKRMTYTADQIHEFQACADPVTGPMYFMDHFFYIQHPTRGRMLYHPFDYQKRLIETYHNYRFSISMMPRQTGKSTSAAGYLLWYAMFIPDSTILVAAHKYTGSQEIMQRIRYAYESVPDHIRAGAVDYNKGSLTFDNGSRIVSATTTENTGRGMSISLLYADEFAFVRPTIATEFWTSISPTLATGLRSRLPWPLVVRLSSRQRPTRTKISLPCCGKVPISAWTTTATPQKWARTAFVPIVRSGTNTPTVTKPGRNSSARPWAQIVSAARWTANS